MFIPNNMFIDIIGLLIRTYVKVLYRPNLSIIRPGLSTYNFFEMGYVLVKMSLL